MVTRADDHALRMRRDERGVLAWCRCGHWGYVGPDADKARNLHAAHVAVVTGRGGGK